MSDRFLLREYYTFEPKLSLEILTETVSKSEPLIIKNVLLQRADAVNGNKRIYPREVLEREDKRYQETIAEKRAVGELDHPDSSIVSLDNGCHRIIETRWNGDDLVGDIEVLYRLTKGKQLLGYLQHKVPLGVSSRGVGSLQQSEDKSASVVGDDFEHVAYDIVSTPSTQGAFMAIKEHRTIGDIRKTNEELLKHALHSILGDNYWNI
jgi:hypothetical protein